jgi:hypothetical protein
VPSAASSITALLFLTGCAGSRAYILEPVEGGDISVSYEDGNTVAWSRKPQSSATIFSARHTRGGKYLVDIAVASTTKKAVNFREDRNIKVAVKKGGAEGDPVVLHVYGASEYLNELDQAQRQQTNALMWSNAIAIATAGTQSVTTTSSATVSAYGTDGYAQASGTASSTTTYTDPVAQDRAAQQARSSMDRLQDSQRRAREAANVLLLKRQTLTPQKNARGVVVIDDGRIHPRTGKTHFLLVWVEVGDDEHFFVLKPTEQQ